MPTKKSKNRPLRKTVRRGRKSISGKVHVPLDVRSKKDLPSLKKLLGNKPLTIVMVYADWCGHCHTMKPHFDAAAKSPNNTVSAAKINETMLPSVNQYIKANVNRNASPLQVQGYPSILLVNQKGEKVTDIEPIRDTKRMQTIMEESGTLAEEAGLNKSVNGNKSVNSNKLNQNNAPEEFVQKIVDNEVVNVSTNAANSTRLNSLSLQELNRAGTTTLTGNQNMKNSMAPSQSAPFNKKNRIVPSKEMQEQAEDLESLIAPMSPTSPPSPSEDIESISNQLSPNEKVGGGRGGSLLEVMSRTTYTMAPAAALLATAAYVMKNNHSGSKRSGSKRRGSKRSGSKRSGSKRRGSKRRDTKRRGTKKRTL